MLQRNPLYVFYPLYFQNAEKESKPKNRGYEKKKCCHKNISIWHMLSHKIHDVNLHTFLFYHFRLVQSLSFTLSNILTVLFHTTYCCNMLCVCVFFCLFKIHLKHLGCIQNEYTVGMNVLYERNIKNNSMCVQYMHS